MSLNIRVQFLHSNFVPRFVVLPLHLWNSATAPNSETAAFTSTFLYRPRQGQLWLCFCARLHVQVWGLSSAQAVQPTCAVVLRTSQHSLQGCLSKDNTAGWRSRLAPCLGMCFQMHISTLCHCCTLCNNKYWRQHRSLRNYRHNLTCLSVFQITHTHTKCYPETNESTKQVEPGVTFSTVTLLSGPPGEVVFVAFKGSLLDINPQNLDGEKCHSHKWTSLGRIQTAEPSIQVIFSQSGGRPSSHAEGFRRYSTPIKNFLITYKS